MTHDEAVNAALFALGAALTKGWPETDPAAAARLVLQQMGDVSSLMDLNDKPVTISGAALMQLVRAAIRAPNLAESLRQSEAEADEFWGRWESARKIMKKPGKPHDTRARLALFELGLIGEEAGQGKSRVDHHGIAAHYALLRTGGHYWGGGGALERVGPHGHHAAVQMIEARYRIEWETLRRGCLRKGIKLCTKAEVYPIP